MILLLWNALYTGLKVTADPRDAITYVTQSEGSEL
jgi:hypothetical protein